MDPVSPGVCEVGHPWFILVAANPTDARGHWDHTGNLEAMLTL